MRLTDEQAEELRRVANETQSFSAACRELGYERGPAYFFMRRWLPEHGYRTEFVRKYRTVRMKKPLPVR